MRYLQPYRWHLMLLPFFAASIYLPISLDIPGDRREFVTISVLYVIADLMMVHYFITESGAAKATALVVSNSIFAGIFAYTLWMHHEAQYLMTAPLFWISAWKLLIRDRRSPWYPDWAGEHMLTVYAFCTIAVGIWMYRTGHNMPTIINLMQLIGICLFGLSLATGNEGDANRREWQTIGIVGVSLYTSTCLMDVVAKYLLTGTFIATPFVAFFASLPMVIVALRDLTLARSLRSA